MLAAFMPFVVYFKFRCYARNLAKLQRTLLLTSSHTTHQPKRPASSHPFNLHWLPIEDRINFKIATPTTWLS